MKTLRTSFPALVLVIIAISTSLSVSAQYTKILDFSGAANGNNPTGDLYYDGNFLYGMTNKGGANNFGVIFKVKPDGTGYVDLLDFADVTNGKSPHGSLISDGTFLYGMTQAGGATGNGTIFKIKPDGTGYLKMRDLNGASDGSHPFGSLISDGTYLYGMPQIGGASNLGTLIKIKPDGTGFAKIMDFTGAANGSEPEGSLVYDGTYMYATTYNGGSHSLGVTFKIKPDGTGYTDLLDFAGATTGSYVTNSVATDGTYLYGMTESGGASGLGTIFRVKNDGTGYVKYLDFNGTANGAFPHGGLYYTGSYLYGVASGGGTYSNGILFRIKPDGTGFIKLWEFPVTTDGKNPFEDLIYDGTYFYGTASNGGVGTYGTVFKFHDYTTGITGSDSVCIGSAITLSDTTAGGTWVSGNTAIATVGTGSGIVTGVAAGTTTISYTFSGYLAVDTITVLPLPLAITGATVLCESTTTTLSDATGTGNWSSSNTSVATITISTGVLSGVSGGTATISYRLSTGCKVTTAVTVNPLPVAGAISGTLVACAGSASALTDGVAGGTWSSGNTSIATTGTSGIVTGVSAGTATISYSYTNSCGTANATATFTVNPLPVAGSITGTTTACAGSATTLTDVVSGGVWSSGSTGVATVSSGGLVTAVAAGISIISYACTNSCGTAVATATVTVNPLPVAGSITGAAAVCVLMTSPLTDATGGGIWSSGASTVATVGSSGVVTGVTAGTATISYTVTNSCGTAVASKTITVNPLPLASPVTGIATVCAGSTTLLGDAAGGGTWSSGATGIATVGSTGLVTGVAGGTATISYTVTSGCGTATATKAVTVNPTPVSGSITGTSTVCAGSSTALTDAATGGVWSSGATGIATIGTSGIVSGVSSGTATISYSVTNMCGSSVATNIITVNTSPFAGTITGTASVCAGSNILLSDAIAGGSWSSSSTAIATVNGVGVVTGVAAGTTTISYAVTYTCGTATATKIVTVNPLPIAGAITGAATVCTGLVTTLADAAGGGVWSSVATSVATVSGAGAVTGVAAGTATISYTVTNGCGTVAASRVATVNPLPDAGTITGATPICVSASTTLTDASTGGLWNSSATGIATVGGTGMVTGVAAGTATISYTVTNSCGVATATKTITVNPLPAAGTITGVSAVCSGSAIPLGDATMGGTWSSGTTSIATVGSSGLVTGVAAGSAIISYSVSNTCGVAFATKAVTVNPLPFAGTITGSATVCTGSVTLFSDMASGGVWSSGATGIASISGGGMVSGISAGTALISYTVTNGCGTAFTTTVLTVHPMPVAGSITGPATVCVLAAIHLSDAAGGGVWSSSNTAIATVNTSGLVTGVSAGTTIISYSVTNGCGTAVAIATISVSPLPVAGSITGASTVCVGATAALSDPATGGLWSSAATGIATVGSSGVVGGVAAGSTILSYVVTNSCGSNNATFTMTVNPLPVPGTVTGTLDVCPGATTALSDAASGGVWSSGATMIASVSSGGIVSGVTAGSAIITYSVTNSCGTLFALATVTVNPAPAVAVITGTTSACVGSATSLSDTSGGGLWSSGNAALATVSGSGAVTAITAGTAIISYTVTNSCGPAFATKTFTCNALPVPTIVVTGLTLSTTIAYSTYQWLMGGLPISGATNSTYTVTDNGLFTVSVTDGNGCDATSPGSAISGLGISDPNYMAYDIKVFPNPASRTLTVSASEKVDVSILGMDGKILMEQNDGKEIDVSNFAPGLYMIRIYNDKHILIKTGRFTKN